MDKNRPAHKTLGLCLKANGDTQIELGAQFSKVLSIGRRTMGRLLRKKDPIKKKSGKSKDQDGASFPEENDNGSAGMKKTVVQVKKAPLSVTKAAVAKKESNFLNKAIQFLREVKIELKKVTWPSRKQTIGSTVVVIVLVMIISLFLGLVDMGLSSLVRVVFQ